VQDNGGIVGGGGADRAFVRRSHGSALENL
jgi:hypothetical protein